MAPNWIILCGYAVTLLVAYALGRIQQQRSMAADLSAATLHGYRSGAFDIERRLIQAQRGWTAPPSTAAPSTGVPAPTITRPRHAADADGDTKELPKAPHRGVRAA